MEMKPEYIELMVDCWDDEPEERPHFYRIVERLKKISGRYSELPRSFYVKRLIPWVDEEKKLSDHLDDCLCEDTRDLNIATWHDNYDKITHQQILRIKICV